MKFLPKALLVGLLLIPVFIFAQQVAPPVIQWSRALGGSLNDKAFSVIRTVDNGYLVVGYSFSNDGQVTGHHGPTTTSDAWVVKLDQSGNILWQRSYGGSADDEFRHVIAVGDGEFICVGTTASTDGDVAGLHGTASDLWALRIDRDGDIIWSRVYGGTNEEHGQVIRKALDGGYVISGDSRSSDGDVTVNNGFYDIWVVKIDELGNLQWQRSFGSSNTQYTADLTVTRDSCYAIAGWQKYTGGQTVYGWSAPSFIKLHYTGSVVWENHWSFPTGVPGNSRYTSTMVELPSGRYYWPSINHDVSLQNAGHYIGYRVNQHNGNIIGYFNEPGEQFFKPDTYTTGPNITLLLPDSSIITGLSATVGDFTNVGGSLMRISTDSLSGRILFKRKFGGSNIDYFTGLDMVNEGEYIAAGTTNSNNGNVSGNHGGYDFWVVRFTRQNQIKGRVFIDDNANGIKDAGEDYYPDLKVQSVKASATSFASTTDASGLFLNHVDTGSYTTTVVLPQPYYTVNPASKVTNFTGYNNKDSFDFALVPVPAHNDLTVSVASLNTLRPGFNAFYRIDYKNAGTNVINGVVVRFIIPGNTNFASATPAPSAVVNDTIFWNIGTLNAFDESIISVSLLADPPPALQIGDVVRLIAAIDPLAGDETPLNNSDTLRQTAFGSYDPNDKAENVAGNISVAEVPAKYLNYTIRFQNTGTDTAFNVVIRDTLDDKLDWNTFEMIGASHDFKLDIKNNHKLAWTFTNILLPDSNVNEPASHGYVAYRVKAKSTLMVGDEVKNSASIYFDFNLPVKTNTTVTTVRPGLPPPSPVVSGILNTYCSNMGVQKGKIDNLPAASSNISVSVSLNATALPVAADSTFSFDVSAMAPGIYDLYVIFSNSIGADTLRMDVRVEPAVTPDVNVSANITTAVNLIDPIIITAANASGGGTTPLYTFSKDRNFTNILKPESVSNILDVDPSTLQAGDNWFYVRMKTSAPCYTAQFNADSIKITMQLPVPPQPLITGMQASYCSQLGIQKGKLGNYPIAGTGATVTVTLDGGNLALAADSSFSFDLSAMTAGTHILEITFANPAGSKTTTFNFDIVAPVTPDVNVTASTTSVLNAADQVIITASNAAGGGNTPLYTFARDHNFAHIIQSESAANTYTISGSALPAGNNWIYVRMKTSSNCYTQQTALDSVMIIKSGSTGLIDPDFPNVRISSNPNPFNGQIVISGLSASKIYTVTIHNMQGRQLLKTRIEGRTTSSLYLPGYMAGTYFIGIYDESKKRMIGTIEIVKQ